MIFSTVLGDNSNRNCYKILVNVVEKLKGITPPIKKNLTQKEGKRTSRNHQLESRTQGAQPPHPRTIRLTSNHQPKMPIIRPQKPTPQKVGGRSRRKNPNLHPKIN